MERDLTEGNVAKSLLFFAMPMILGNMLQQFYNIADTLIVGRALGEEALAAVGSAYTLMTFLTSILIGLCMGSGAAFSYYFGKKDISRMKNSMCIAFLLIGLAAAGLHVGVLCFSEEILLLLQIPPELMGMMKEYTDMVFMGIFFVFLYNYFAYLLRAVGNSVVPLCFLGTTALLNVGLDLLFVLVCGWGIWGAALATVISQAASGVGIAIYTWIREKPLRPCRAEIRFSKTAVMEIAHFSITASVQQSVMNFGILMVQGLVNSFGAVVMAAFAAGVKIDTLAYMPAQEFGNAFSLFISQNYGAGKYDRVKKGTRFGAWLSVIVVEIIGIAVYSFAPSLVRIFHDDPQVVSFGVLQARTVVLFYCLLAFSHAMAGVLRGLGLSKVPMYTMLGFWCALRICWNTFVAAPTGNIQLVFWSYPLTWTCSTVALLSYYLYKNKKYGIARMVRC